MDEKTIISQRIRVVNATEQHRFGIRETVRSAYKVVPGEICRGCINDKDVIEQLERFPEGQFVAIYEQDDGQELVVGMASTMRTSYPPTQKPRSWMGEIGTKGIANHDPNGEWLYGVEMSVRPSHRRMGVGTKLYQARFEFVKKLNLKGWYAGGVLMGYHRYRDQMTPREYGEKVIHRELIDPTVTMQMNRGFEAREVIDEYLDEEDAGNAAVLIVWNNPEYQST